MDHDQIAEHVATYDKYLELTELKKDMILKYKEVKTKEKQEKINQAEQETSNLGKVDRSLGLPKRTKSSAARRQTSKDIRAELNDWRRQKEEENA